jgi:hypothetical protein
MQAGRLHHNLHQFIIFSHFLRNAFRMWHFFAPPGVWLSGYMLWSYRLSWMRNFAWVIVGVLHWDHICRRRLTFLFIWRE